ncbi:MAG: DUF1573 domain-containing protein [Chitinophagaceae bacterium]|jgi:hypothetical protein|nr:DUF1573 domain-containing protein [Chitinophagaceae bacterium]
MKKTIVLFSTLALISLSSVAQNKDVKQPTDKAQVVATPAAPAQNPDLSIKFNQEDHNFGNVPEGPSVSYDFEFKNIGKVPIIFSDVHGSCGCTVPVWPKEPILPGKSSKIAVTYSTQGRQGQINKTVTVTSNIGTKILKISGNVDKADPAATPTDTKQPAH